jgi:hypothetical protein
MALRDYFGWPNLAQELGSSRKPEPLSRHQPCLEQDKIDLNLPMDLQVSPMPDDEQIQAMMYGLLVVAGMPAVSV